MPHAASQPLSDDGAGEPPPLPLRDALLFERAAASGGQRRERLAGFRPWELRDQLTGYPLTGRWIRASWEKAVTGGLVRGYAAPQHKPRPPAARAAHPPLQPLLHRRRLTIRSATDSCSCKLPNIHHRCNAASRVISFLHRRILCNLFSLRWKIECTLAEAAQPVAAAPLPTVGPRHQCAHGTSGHP